MLYSTKLILYIINNQVLRKIKIVYENDVKNWVLHARWWRSEAVTVFGDLGIQVVTGHRFLGGFLGSRSERDEYVMSKVCKWVEHVDVLAGAAVTQPQLAYAALSNLCSMNGNFCYVLFRSAVSCFRNLNCHSFLLFYQPCLVLKCLQLNDVCLRFLYG